jgi:hypothetical protein
VFPSLPPLCYFLVPLIVLHRHVRTRQKTEADFMATCGLQVRMRRVVLLVACIAAATTTAAGARVVAGDWKGLRREKHAVPLVTGCGSSGTHSAAAMLQQLGVNAPHEGYVSNGVSVGWPYAAIVQHGEDIGFDYPPKGRYPFESVSAYAERTDTLSIFKPVVLLVRDPLHVIASTRRCFCAKGSRLTETQLKNYNRSWWFVEQKLNLSDYLQHRALLQRWLLARAAAVRGVAGASFSCFLCHS